jgi:uncharacterized membrane protein
MEVNDEKARLLNQAIEDWLEKGLIDEDTASSLKKTFTVRRFDWRQLTVYAFIIAVICAVLSVIVLLADKPLREWMQRLTNLTDTGISELLTIAAVLIFWHSKRRFKKHPSTPFSNHSFLLLGCFFSIAAISFWAKTFHIFQHNYFAIFLLAAVLYFFLSVRFEASVLWVLAILMIAVAYASWSAFYSDTDNFFGMNYPIRFLPFGILLLLASSPVKNHWRFRLFYPAHLVTALLFFYVSLWLITIFGNYNSLERWNEVRQVHFLPWDVLLLLVSAVGMYSGLKRNDLITGNISLIFFILNLLSRYFEYFWEPLHKSVFFLLLALIFWFIGSRAEKLWNLRFLEDK